MRPLLLLSFAFILPSILSENATLDALRGLQEQESQPPAPLQEFGEPAATQQQDGTANIDNSDGKPKQINFYDVTNKKQRVYVNQIKFKSFSALLQDSFHEYSMLVDSEKKKMEVMYEAMKDTEYVKKISGNFGEKDCVSKQRIVLDVNRCGLGNRVMAVFSTIVFGEINYYFFYNYIIFC